MMCRVLLEQSLPGPPPFFTRQRDGIPVPVLDVFMTGHRNLFKMDIPSKTLETSYLARSGLTNRGTDWRALNANYVE
jgi:hypothetical protein